MSDHDTTLMPDPSAPVAARTLRAGLHPVNVGHLVMGVAFVGLAIIWALIESGAAPVHDLHWMLPIPWVAAGLAGLVATAPRLRGSRD